MTRKYVDCRDQPSVSGCTLAISGEEDELVRAAALHMADVHEHPDTAELRDAIRDDLRDAPAMDTMPGSFVQLIEFHTDRIDEVEAVMREWADVIGSARTARWEVLGADHDQSHRYIQIVQFPDYAAAMANSRHAVTARFAERLHKLCDGDAQFINLDVRNSSAF
jgi:predicted small metal-binding protein